MSSTMLNHYQILREVGRGAMGRVYLARDTRLSRNVALKIPPPALVADVRRRKRFERESRTLAALNHPNIVTIHAVEEAEGQPFLVMEWIEGSSLEELIEPGGFPLARVLEIGIPLVEAVAQAHQAGIIHRDLKPGNIMVRIDGVVKVVDFGISLMEQETAVDGHPAITQESLTGEGMVVGTIPYMAPEQLEGRAVDSRADLFALGIILYEMSTGTRPFQGDSSASLVSSILRDDPPPLFQTEGSLRSSLGALVARCLAKRPQDRFPSAAELGRELQGLRRELESGTALPSPPTLPLLLPSEALAPPVLSLPASTPGAAAGLPRLRRPAVVRVALAAVLAGALAIGASRILQDLQIAPAAAPPSAAAGTVLNAATRSLTSSVAVLPLRNMSGDPNQEFFSDGTTEAMIANLAKIGGLRVSSRNAVMPYKGRQVPMAQIARELGVRHVLEGSVLRSGEQLMIIVQLVDPATDGTIWGDTYRGSVGDIFAFQQQVAEAVARQTKGELTESDRSRLAHVQEVAPEVYETYLRARYLLHQRSPEALWQALALIDQALAQDQRYALGWATKAECYLYLTTDAIAVLSPSEGLPKALEAARRAVELDESLSEAHAALAFALLQSWQWQDVERELRRALELNPSNADAYLKFTLFLTAQARHDEAIATVERVRQLDPGSLHVRITSTGNYLYARRYEEAAESARSAIALQPDHWLPRFLLGIVLSLQGKYADADTELRQAVRDSQSNPLVVSALARNEALAGRTAEARRLVAEMEAASRRGWVPPSALAVPLFALGDADRGFVWLQKAVDARDQSLLLFAVSPYYSGYRKDPRYQEILRQIGLDRG
jgi:eukaryotic-like serine/threonine-protein kinase